MTVILLTNVFVDPDNATTHQYKMVVSHVLAIQFKLQTARSMVDGLLGLHGLSVQLAVALRTGRASVLVAILVQHMGAECV